MTVRSSQSDRPEARDRDDREVAEAGAGEPEADHGAEAEALAIARGALPYGLLQAPVRPGR